MKPTNPLLALALTIPLAAAACAHHAKHNTVGRVESEPLVLGPATPDAAVPVGQTSLTSGDMVSGDMVSSEMVNSAPLTDANDPLAASSGQDGDMEIARIARSRIQEATVSTASGPRPVALQNVDISASGGTVVLRGQVPSADERSAIEAAASRVPGVVGVDSRLTVAARRR